MTHARARAQAAAGVTLAAMLTGCGLLSPGGEEANVKTPRQAREGLVQELTAIANEIIPGGDASVRIVVPEHGCGAGGTGRDRIFADISGISEDPDLTAAPDEVIATAKQSLSKHGWKIIRAENYNNTPSLAFQDDTGAGGELVYMPDSKSISISAHTECLSNPDQ